MIEDFYINDFAVVKIVKETVKGIPKDVIIQEIPISGSMVELSGAERYANEKENNVCTNRFYTDFENITLIDKIKEISTGNIYKVINKLNVKNIQQELEFVKVDCELDK
jgi:hypothetical protein